jgi:hypothetical protein
MDADENIIQMEIIQRISDHSWSYDNGEQIFPLRMFSLPDISPSHIEQFLSPGLTMKTPAGANEILQSCNSQHGLELHPLNH